jgi:hypothetical protein
MNKYLKYLSYVVRHKFWVGVACFRMGLYWRGIKHDWTKLTPSEFFPYARFFGSPQPPKDKTGYYKPTDTGDVLFETAWLSHTRKNTHHWQYHVMAVEDGEKLYDMPDEDVLEMICDWWGASRAQKTKSSPKEWYYAHKELMRFSPLTQHKVETYLEEIPFVRIVV